MQLYVRPNGTAQCLYDEKILLTTLGCVDIKRASHVEPDPKNPGQWYADLGPVGGPRLENFMSRDAALKAEAEWLNNEMRQKNVRVR